LFVVHTHAQTHTHTTIYGSLGFCPDYPGETAPERYNQEGKTNLDLLEQETVSGSGISCWPYANVHLDPDTYQASIPSFKCFTAWMPFLLPN